jgi:hypothetical protein
MMKRRNFLVALAGGTLLPLMPTEAHAAQWRRLGMRRVNGLVDVDSIHVGAGAGRFDRVRIGVRGNALLIYDVRVRFVNGGEQRLNVRLLIPQGGYTRSIDLRSSNRRIRDVVFTYGKLRNGLGPTYVDLYGLR